MTPKAKVKIETPDVPTESHTCDQCGKSFANNSNLLRHKNIHADLKPFKCNDCGKCFRQKSYLKLHNLIHTNELPHSCDSCPKRFRLVDSLRRHMVIHSDQQPFSCELCGRKFKCKRSLKRHQVTHTKEKPHKCLTCGKCFSLIKVSKNISHSNIQMRGPTNAHSVESNLRGRKILDIIRKHTPLKSDTDAISATLLIKVQQVSVSTNSVIWGSSLTFVYYAVPHLLIHRSFAGTRP